ncbi:SDR family NAD(P)-dependent oxidoreductase [Lachnospiraceae bacterium ASD3451]|uniref:SDR family NAD(P)-dependent oxidoreductase n=1 Tax=Diplocloster agilis TaxID=2850323 RepID=UPI001D6C0B72|nr:SDR family NAD(P)-dependent oxidoreductase [Diplocloster agilis]MBU9744951.1 SDR family NAD(P)-dependent oxidoreductase [Diplocloster agilis]
MEKNVVVTGAGQGLGNCVVKKSLEEGFRVYAVDRTITEELNSLKNRYPEQLEVLRCDISSMADVDRTGEFIKAHTKRIDILYNIAGIYRFCDKVGLADTNMESEAFLTMYDVNAVGPLRMCKALADRLGGGSVIINISSEAGSIGSCWRTQEYAYCMSKAALNMGAKILSNELKDRDIRIFNLHPGWLKTSMGGEEAMKSEEAVTPEESAGHIMQIAEHPETVPKDRMFMEYTMEPLVW